MKQKVSIVPKWVSPEMKNIRIKIRLIEFRLKNSAFSGWERERAESQLQDLRADYRAREQRA